MITPNVNIESFSSNLYLIGYRGCGKSTVAKILSEMLGWSVVDADEEIETLAGTSISQIFESEQEAGFRRRESLVIESLAKRRQTVIALGGGAVLAECNRERIAESGKAVWLKISAETSWERISGDEKSVSQRPNLTQTGGIEEIEQMLAIRTPIYQSCADLVVEADSRTPSEIAAVIFDYIASQMRSSDGE